MNIDRQSLRVDRNIGRLKLAAIVAYILVWLFIYWII